MRLTSASANPSPSATSEASPRAAATPAGPGPASVAPEVKRGQGLDALRAVMTMLVVLHHTAITYGAMGGWFYKEILPNGSLQSKLLIFFCTFNQSFFMGLFFLLAGYFTPGALQRKGVSGYLRDRFIRLGLPLLFFGFVLGPITIAWAQTANGKPFLETLAFLLRHGEFERGPLWFCQALLIFACAATVVFKLGALRAVPAPGDRHLLWAAIATGAAAFLLRLVWPVGTTWWGLQLGYFAGYLTLFWGGYAAASTRWLERLDPAQVHRWRRVCRWTLPVLPVLALAAPTLPVLQGAGRRGLACAGGGVCLLGAAGGLGGDSGSAVAFSASDGPEPSRMAHDGSARLYRLRAACAGGRRRGAGVAAGGGPRAGEVRGDGGGELLGELPAGRRVVVGVASGVHALGEAPGAGDARVSHAARTA